MKKIAFCFLIYDIIIHEELWNLFFQNVDKNKYEIYIHYKHNVPLKFFNKYKLDNCVDTKYADVSLIYAINTMFKKAFDDDCYKFVILSQSCIPLKSFNYVYDFLSKDDKAYFNVSPSCQVYPKCNPLLEYYNKEHIKKSSQWFILNRTICSIILKYDNDSIEKRYKDIYAPEENFYITEVYHNNLSGEIITTPNLAAGATTFTFWSDVEYKFCYPKHYGLKNYYYITNEELSYLIESKSLFGRKFTIECSQFIYNNITYLQHIFST